MRLQPDSIRMYVTFTKTNQPKPSKNMTKLILLSLIPALLLTGCFAQTDPGPTDSQAGAPADALAPACPAVIECGWHHNPDTNTDQCSGNFAAGTQKRFGLQDDGASSCWYYDTVCVTPGTPADCIPDACRREFVTCQPTQPMGLP